MASSVIFCSSSKYTFPGILSMFDYIPFFITPSASIATGIVVTLIFHILPISISKSSYFQNVSTSFIDSFLSEGIVISISWHVVFI